MSLHPRWPLVAALAGAAYPLAPGFLHAMTRSASQSPLSGLPLLAAGAASVLLAPLVGATLLWWTSDRTDPTALRARAVGMLLFVAPVLLVLTSVLANMAGVGRGGNMPFWYGLWFLGAAMMTWRASVPRPLLSSGTTRRARLTHRLGASVVVLFAATHLAVNLTAFQNLDTYNQAAGWFRTIYRTPFAEPVLIAFLLMQLGSGLALALETAVRRISFEHACQIAAGLFIGLFLTSHTLAVAVLGRGLLDRGPDFTFASAGPGGLFASVGGTALAPYYGLAVLSVFLHLARPLRLWLMARTGPSPARVTANALVGVGLVVCVVLLMVLITPIR